MNENDIKRLLKTIDDKNLIQFKNRLIAHATRNTQHATRTSIHRNRCDELLKKKENI